MGTIQESKTQKNKAVKAWFDKGNQHQLLGHSIFTISEPAENKPTIILLHGFPTSSFDWAPIWPMLKDHFQLISLDLLGFGFSSKPKNIKYSIHLQADIVEATIKKFSLHTFHLLAHDYSVSVAQELLARQFERKQENILSCCFLNGGLFPETHKALLIQRLLLTPAGKFITALTGFKQFRQSFSKVFGSHSKPTDSELAAFWEIINYNDGKHLFYNLITYMNDRIEHRQRWLTPLQQSPVPLALINGSADPVSGKHLCERYQQLGCRLDHLHELSTIGHYPQLESPATIANSYTNFLQKIEKIS